MRQERNIFLNSSIKEMKFPASHDISALKREYHAFLTKNRAEAEPLAHFGVLARGEPC
jgi:hypothetical protein